MLRNHGWTRGTRMVQNFEDEYRFESMGYNLRPLEMHAAVAREQLMKLSSHRFNRTRNYQHWLFASEGLPLGHPVILGSPSFFGIHFCVQNSHKRTQLARALRASGIDCRPPVAGSFRKQPYGARWSDQSTPMADIIHDCGLMIGNPPWDATEWIDKAIRIMREWL